MTFSESIEKMKLSVGKSPTVISICSGKGGVGKSVLSANIAYQLSKSGCKVLVWDTNLQFPNQHLLFAVEPPVRLNEVMSSKINVSSAIYQIDKDLFILAGSPADYDFSENNISIIKVFEDIINNLEFDYIILDTPAGYSDDILQASMISDMILTVVTDEPTSLLDAYGLIKILLNKIDSKKINLLVNNVIDIEDADEISYKLNLAMEKFLKLIMNSIGFVPYDRIVRQSILQQELFIKAEPESEVSKSIDKISKKIMEWIN